MGDEVNAAAVVPESELRKRKRNEEWALAKTKERLAAENRKLIYNTTKQYSLEYTQTMPLQFCAKVGYNDGEDLLPPKKLSRKHVDPFCNVVENVIGDPELNYENADPEDIEDEEELLNVGVDDVDEEFKTLEDLFVGESRHTRLITKEILHLIGADPSIRISTLVAKIAKKCKVTIAYNKAWYAKQVAVAQLFGDWKESYAKLPRLLLGFQEKHPGSIMSMLKSAADPVTNECQLIRFFWAFGPSLQGFHHCRPVLSIDVTHLYGKYNGKLFVALGVDGNGQIFPVAFGMVQEKTKADWGWFLKNLREAIGPRPNLCLISDRHVNIIAAVNDPNNGWAAPLATHRFCLRHIRSNFNTRFKNITLKKLVYKIGSEVEMCKFEEGMEKLKKLHTDGYNWCKEIPKEQWSLAYDGGYRYGCCTTNIVECFNGILLASRNLPICTMFMLIFHRLVKYFVENRNNWNRMIYEHPHDMTDRGVELLNDSRDHARDLHCSHIYCQTRGMALVNSILNNTQRVDLSSNSCDCGSWLQYKVACGHVIRVCMTLNVDYTTFVHQMYKLDAYRLVYRPQFYPLSLIHYWPKYDGPTLIPLHGTLRGIGRHPSTQFRNEMD